MKAEIKIPKGWRRLRRGETVKAGDRWLDSGESLWVACNLSVGMKVKSDMAIRSTKSKSRKSSNG